MRAHIHQIEKTLMSNQGGADLFCYTYTETAPEGRSFPSSLPGVSGRGKKFTFVTSREGLERTDRIYSEDRHGFLIPAGWEIMRGY